MTSADALARIRRYDPRLKAFVRVFDPALAGETEGGPTIAIKDLMDIAGVPTGGGAQVPLDANPAHHAVVVERLLMAGWNVVGKTHTVELAYGGWGTNRAVGAPWNPWDAKVHRAPGGSSSGSAGAGAARPFGRGPGPRTRRSGRDPAGVRRGGGGRPLRRGPGLRHRRLGAHPGGGLRRGGPEAGPRPGQPQGRASAFAGAGHGGDAGSLGGGGCAGAGGDLRARWRHRDP